MNKLLITCLLAATAIFSGCATTTKIPMQEYYPASYQKRVLTTAHWDILAKDIADKLPLSGSIYLHQISAKKAQDEMFNAAFSGLLLTHLTQKGVMIAQEDNTGQALNIETYLIPHKLQHELRPNNEDQINRWILAGVGAGVGSIIGNQFSADRSRLTGAVIGVLSLGILGGNDGNANNLWQDFSYRFKHAVSGQTFGDAKMAAYELLIIVTYADHGNVRLAQRHIVYIGADDKNLYEGKPATRKINIE